MVLCQISGLLVVLWHQASQPPLALCQAGRLLVVLCRQASPASKPTPGYAILPRASAQRRKVNNAPALCSRRAASWAPLWQHSKPPVRDVHRAPAAISRSVVSVLELEGNSGSSRKRFHHLCQVLQTQGRDESILSNAARYCRRRIGHPARRVRRRRAKAAGVTIEADGWVRQQPRLFLHVRRHAVPAAHERRISDDEHESTRGTAGGVDAAAAHDWRSCCCARRTRSSCGMPMCDRSVPSPFTFFLSSTFFLCARQRTRLRRGAGGWAGVGPCVRHLGSVRGKLLPQRRRAFPALPHRPGARSTAARIYNGRRHDSPYL